MTDESAKNEVLNNSVLFCEKEGMTRIFDENGNHVPVTVLRILETNVVQVKTTEKDGYQSLKLGLRPKKAHLINKPKQGELKKANLASNYSTFKEVPFVDGAELGSSFGLDNFNAGALVSVTGVSKGKGFAGVMKKYNFAGGPASHGSKFHRTTGSIGNRATPGKVWKGKKMPGHMGVEKKTIKNIKVVECNTENGYILVKGSVPGHKKSLVKLTKQG